MMRRVALGRATIGGGGVLHLRRDFNFVQTTGRFYRDSSSSSHSAWNSGSAPSKGRSYGWAGGCRGSFASAAPIGLTALVGGAATAAAATLCEDQKELDRKAQRHQPRLAPNPLWPKGVPNKMVEDFVSSVLETDANIAGVPDAIERQIYVSTVRLTLNAVYKSLGELHGTEFLGHRLQLHRLDDEARKGEEFDYSKLGAGEVDERALEDVADRLLANKAVNRPLVPDAIERQVYVNCLKLVFSLLDALAATLGVTVCGHDVRLDVRPSSSRVSASESLRERAKERSSSLTPVDVKAVEAFARESGAAPPPDADASLFGRWLEPTRREFVAQLHATMYSLVLGILDDLLNDTVLTFLSDRVRIDIVPSETLAEKTNVTMKEEEAVVVGAMGDDDAKGEEDFEKPSSLMKSPPVAFVMGVGVGAAMMIVMF